MYVLSCTNNINEYLKNYDSIMDVALDWMNVIV